MKNRNCPNKDACWDYDASNCTGCELGEKFSRLTRQIKQLKAENAELRRRAEVAEREAMILAKWLANKTRKDYPWKAWFNAAQKQAEKELAEEKKDANRI